VRYYLGQRQDLKESEAAQNTASKFGISIASVRRYAKAYAEGGTTALKPEKLGPKTATTQIPIAVTMLVVTIRTLLGWCGQRVAAELDRREIFKLSHTTVYRIFRRYHIKTRTYHPKAVRNGIDYGCFQRNRPDELWHVDFKGPLKVGSDTLYLLVIEDDYSRYVLDVHVCQDCTADTAIARIQLAFQQYGVPRQLMSDNGAAFTSVWEDVIHRFEQTLRDYGVEHLLIPPYYPEANGKVEAFIKTLSKEALALLADKVETPQALQKALDLYVTYYNNYRCHSALKYQPPVSRYLGTTPAVSGLAGIFGLPDLGLKQWDGFCQPPPSPVRALVAVSESG
jgi:transposase InsO family protein